MYKNALLIAISTVLLLLSGCAQLPVGKPVASINNVKIIKESSIPPVKLGEFTPKDAGAKWDKVISVRSNSVKSPIEDSFSKYLKATLATELEAAGLLNNESQIVIEATLLKNDIDAAIGTGTAIITAKFTVANSGALLFEKEYTATSEWESSFIGAVAIPAAMNQYTELHRKLVGELLQDEAFQQALKSIG